MKNPVYVGPNRETFWLVMHPDLESELGVWAFPFVPCSSPTRVRSAPAVIVNNGVRIEGDFDMRRGVFLETVWLSQDGVSLEHANATHITLGLLAWLKMALVPIMLSVLPFARQPIRKLRDQMLSDSRRVNQQFRATIENKLQQLDEAADSMRGAIALRDHTIREYLKDMQELTEDSQLRDSIHEALREDDPVEYDNMVSEIMLRIRQNAAEAQAGVA